MEQECLQEKNFVRSWRSEGECDTKIIKAKVLMTGTSTIIFITLPKLHNDNFL